MNQQLTNLLTGLAAKLGTTVQYLWSVEVKQSYIVAVSDLVWCVVLIAAIFGLYRLFKWCLSVRKEMTKLDREFDFSYAFGMVLSVVAIALCVIFIGLDSTSAIGHFTNPQYYAFQDIVSSIR